MITVLPSAEKAAEYGGQFSESVASALSCVTLLARGR